MVQHSETTSCSCTGKLSHDLSVVNIKLPVLYNFYNIRTFGKFTAAYSIRYTLEYL